ncbi:MAG: AmmeMemoRadiSam system radical SAM enzyme [Candidatus Delongbacteria bacterium]|nr:AmmeMemoRadiSam system radical SAM enzyme [Candidatus Delongbacteria bacterium]
MHEARYYRHQEAGEIQCGLCPHACRLQEGQLGRCRGRQVQSGRLITRTYGQIVSLALDPIEKKPLYHFYPGSSILSTGPNACNLGCIFCQNWSISQQIVHTEFIPVHQLVTAALSQNSIGVAFTYTEPLMMIEYILDAAPALRSAGLKTVLVTNGYINPAPLQDLLPWVDAMNIDLKGFRDDFYQTYTGGHLQPVLETIRSAHASCMVELTCLLIPGLNDQDAEIQSMAEWIAGIDPNLPLHFSRYYPQYKCRQPVTPPESLKNAHQIASRYLNHVYIGNISLDQCENSYCRQCRHLVVQRRGYQIRITGLTPGGNCAECGTPQYFRLPDQNSSSSKS